METNAPKRRDNKKSLRVKVISLGNAEVGKVRVNLLVLAQNSNVVWCLSAVMRPAVRNLDTYLMFYI